MENYKNRIITISGDPASGKGSVTKALKQLYEADGLKVKVVSVGDIFRKVVVREYKKKFPNIDDPSLEDIQSDPNFQEELNQIDEKLDNEIAKIGEEFNSQDRRGEILIVDSRLAWFKIPDSFAVRLTVDAETAGKRVFNDPKRGAEDQYPSEEEAIKETASRREIEIARYKGYGADLTDHNNFQLVIGTTLADINDIARTIKICEELKRQDKPFAKTWASPELFYPTQGIGQTDERYVWKLNEEECRKNPRIYPFATTKQVQEQYPEMQINHRTKQAGKWVRGIYDLQEFAHMIQEDGIYPDQPITSTTRGNSIYQFVQNGHHRVFGSIIAGKTLIPYKIIGHTDKETIDIFQHRYIYSHEFRKFDGSIFRFEKIPKLEEKTIETSENEEQEQ